MALAWKPRDGVEGEDETVPEGGLLSSVVEWKEEGCGEIDGFLVRVLIYSALLKVVALRKGARFEAEFGSDALESAGMDPRLGFDDYTETLCSALTTERLEVSSKVLADGSSVVWIVAEKMGRRTFEYRLELPFAALDQSESLRLELDESKDELAETKQQLAVSQKENESLRAALAKSKAESTELIAEIRSRDAHMCELTKTLAGASSLTHWTEAEVFSEVSGHSVALRRAVAAECLRVEATPKAPTDFKFQQQFDADGLKQAGFGRMPFADSFQLIRGSLKKEMGMSATLNANGSDAVDLDIEAPVAYFSAEYKLPLQKTDLSLLEKVSAQLCASKKQLAAARIELVQLKSALKESTADGDAAKQRLAEASAQAAAGRRSAEQTLAESKTESERISAELKAAIAECRTLEQRLVKEKTLATAERRAADELRAEVHIREESIRELKAVVEKNATRAKAATSVVETTSGYPPAACESQTKELSTVHAMAAQLTARSEVSRAGKYPLTWSQHFGLHVTK